MISVVVIWLLNICYPNTVLTRFRNLFSMQLLKCCLNDKVTESKTKPCLPCKTKCIAFESPHQYINANILFENMIIYEANGNKLATYKLACSKPFRTLVGLIDDYFEDYFSQEMIESQVSISILHFMLVRTWHF